jgi:hypothetical protein
MSISKLELIPRSFFACPLAILAIVTASSAASAQDEAAPTADETATPEAGDAEGLQAVPNKMNLGVPDLPPPRDRTYKVHRGLYLGLGAGPGLQGATFDINTPGIDGNLSGSGFNLSLDLLVGGSLTPGFALGGGVVTDFMLSSDFDGAGGLEDDSAGLTSIIVGPFADGYPNPKGPWHLGATVGLAYLMSSLGDDYSEPGLGFAGWVGLTPWVSDEMSMGVKLRFMGNVTGFGEDVKGSSRSLNLMFDAVYF